MISRRRLLNGTLLAAMLGTRVMRGSDAFGAAPRTPLEQQIARVWSELLHVEPVGATDDFFQLGGHSLLAIQATMRLRDLLEAPIATLALFEARTVEGLAVRIAGSGGGQSTAFLCAGTLVVHRTGGPEYRAI